MSNMHDKDRIFSGELATNFSHNTDDVFIYNAVSLMPNEQLRSALQ